MADFDEMNLETILESNIKLPPSPQILPKLQAIVRDVDASIFDIIELIRVDAPLTVQVMKLANSAYFGAMSPCETIEDAISRIGFSETLKIVSMAAAKQVLGNALPIYRMGKGELLEISVVTALTMSSMVQARDADTADTAYTVGLLHPLGKAIINAYYIERGIEIYGQDAGEIDYALERSVLGFDNAQVAAGFMKKWKFAEHVIETVNYQFNPLAAPQQKKFASILAIAQQSVPLVLSDNPISALNGTGPNPEMLEISEMSDEDYCEHIHRARESLLEVQDLLGSLK